MQTAQGNNDQQIITGRAVIAALSVTSITADGYIELYDGHNTGGKLVAKLAAKDGTSFALTDARFLVFQEGVFVHVSADTTTWVLAYVTAEREGQP